VESLPLSFSLSLKGVNSGAAAGSWFFVDDPADGTLAVTITVPTRVNGGFSFIAHHYVELKVGRA
jgi:hypothetical protein